MTALDTNILVRYLVQDDPRLCPPVNDFISRQCTLDDPGFINHIVLCELVWVLETSYGYSKPMILETLYKLISTSQFAIENQGAVVGAVLSYKNSKADFADALIGKMNKLAGYSKTVTLDTGAAQLPEFEFLSSK